MEQFALKRAQEWINSSHIDEADKIDIRQIIKDKNNVEIVERFYKDLEFGTGGMRSILGNGVNRMNKYTVRKATQALANTLLDSKKKELKVAISYDSRKFSYEFAKETASVLA